MPKAKPPKAQTVYGHVVTKEYAHEIAIVKAGVAEALKHLPKRATIGQLQAWLEVAANISTNVATTVSDLKNVGENAHKTYQALVEEEPIGQGSENSEGLLWLMPDSRDTRRKYLFLTHNGIEAVAHIAQAVRTAKAAPPPAPETDNDQVEAAPKVRQQEVVRSLAR